MKFLPAINLWDRAIERAILSGQLKLQVGQYVYCGTDGKLSRFVSVNLKSRTFNIVHGDTFELVNMRFKERVEALKKAKERRQRLQRVDKSYQVVLSCKNPSYRDMATRYVNLTQSQAERIARTEQARSESLWQSMGLSLDRKQYYYNVRLM